MASTQLSERAFLSSLTSHLPILNLYELSNNWPANLYHNLRQILPPVMDPDIAVNLWILALEQSTQSQSLRDAYDVIHITIVFWTARNDRMYQRILWSISIPIVTPPRLTTRPIWTGEHVFNFLIARFFSYCRSFSYQSVYIPLARLRASFSKGGMMLRTRSSSDSDPFHYDVMRHRCGCL
jgi:hypothetical protein